jgi:tetratricopeptide (TPR) repeat protein
MSKTKRILIAVIAAVVLIVVMVAVILINKPSEAVHTAASHISLAENYLLELDYVAAIAEYRMAIQIDPKNADYYIALAEVYIEMGDTPAAIAVLEEGLAAVDEPDKKKIQDLIDELTPMHLVTAATTPKTTTTMSETTTTINPETAVTSLSETETRVTTIALSESVIPNPEFDFESIVGLNIDEAKIIVMNNGYIPLIQEDYSGGLQDLNLVYSVELFNGVNWLQRDSKKYEHKYLRIFSHTYEYAEGNSIATENRIPDLTGYRVEDAKLYLENYGFKVLIKEDCNGIFESGIVSDSSTDWVQWYDERFNTMGYEYYKYVDLFVSAGSVNVDEQTIGIIPKIDGLDSVTAIEEITKAGFKPSGQIQSFDPTLPYDSVYIRFNSEYFRTSTGAYLEKGDYVHFDRSLGPLVPKIDDKSKIKITFNTVGMQYEDAKSALEKFGYKVTYERVSCGYMHPEDNDHALHSVVMQEPWDYEGFVMLYICSGEDDSEW